MLSPEDLTRQHELLAVQRRTLHHYLRQHATLGSAYAPPAVTAGISEARAEIKRIKQLLRAQGASVTDQPQDDASDGDSLPGAAAVPSRTYRRAIGFAIGAAIVILLLWRVVGSAMQAPTQAVGSAAQPTAGTRAPAPLSIALPEGDTVTILYKDATITYRIVKAEVQLLNDKQPQIALTMSASTTYYYGINFKTEDFRLRLDTDLVKPLSAFDEAIYPGETKEGVVAFPIPSEPAQAHVVFTIGATPVELLLDVKQ